MLKKVINRTLPVKNTNSQLSTQVGDSATHCSHTNPLSNHTPVVISQRSDSSNHIPATTNPSTTLNHTPSIASNSDTSNHKFYNLIYFNALSLVNKIDFLDILLKQELYDFIFITETWLKPKYPDPFIINNNAYSVYRTDRLFAGGGGVCILVKSSIATHISLVNVDNYKNKSFEVVAVDFYYAKYKCCRLICIYFPPQLTHSVEEVNTLIKTINSLNNKPEIIVVGDFNFATINWNNLLSHRLGQPSQSFINYLNSNNLNQMILFSTHKHGNILDLLITSNPTLIFNIEKAEPFSPTCDHNLIIVKLNIQSSIKNKFIKKRNFYRGDYESINTFLSNTNWNDIFNDCLQNDINLTYSKFTSVIHQSIEQYIPYNKPKFKPKLPKHIKTLLTTKQMLYKRIEIDSTSKHLYNEISKLYKRAISQYRFFSEQNILQNGSKKSFYGYINKKIHTRIQLPPLIDKHNNIIIEPQEQADLLNSQFVSVFTSDNGITPTIKNLSFQNYTHTMEDIEITPDLVVKSVNNLKNSVSRSPDCIPAMFLKQTISTLAEPLAQLFSASLKLGKVPDCWLQQIITPIYKKGLKSLPSNWRPIAGTSPTCRTLEDIIRNHITSFLLKNNIISKVQYGFLAGRSTLTQQLNLLNSLTYNYERNVQSEIIYLDFAKAFDSVSHQKLLFLLNHLGINTTILTWINSYLSNRSQQTVVQNCLSRLRRVTSGVPQGSVLGPLLFLLYLEELLYALQKCEDIKVFAFADDLKILSHNPTQLQHALKIVEEYSTNWQLRIQPPKSEHIIFSRQSNHSNTDFFINNSLIPKCTSVKDLGIVLSNDIKWCTYISKVHSRATNLVYLILKTFKSMDPFFYRKLFITYIRPLTEYNVNIWMPYYLGDIKKIESVQSLFTRMLCKKFNITYKNYFHRLQILNLESLELRRIKTDLILTYKILNNLIDLQSTDYFCKSNFINSYNLRRHSHHLQYPDFPKTTIRQNFFNYRIVNLWNRLPEKVVSSRTLQSFINNLNKLDLYRLFPPKL